MCSFDRSRRWRRGCWIGALVFAGWICRGGESGGNLVRQGGFDVPKPGQPAAWSVRNPAMVSYGTRAKAAADRYVILTSKKAGDNTLILQNNLPLKGGVGYMVSYDVKAKKGATYRVYIEWWKDAGGYGGSVNTVWRQGTGYWEHESFRLPFSKGMKPPYIVLQVQGPGQVAFDNVRVYKPVREPVRAGCVFSADFEAGPGAWELPGGARIVKGDAASGQAYLSISGRGPGHNPMAVHRGIPTSPGRRYRLSYRVRSGGGSDEVTGFQFYRVMTSWERLIKDGRDYGTVSQREGEAWQDCYGAWQRRILDFTAPVKPTAGMTISCQVKGPGTVQIDDMELRELPGGGLDAPLEIDIFSPPYRAVVFPGEETAGIRGRVRVSSPEVRFISVGLRGGATPAPQAVPAASGGRLAAIPFSFDTVTGVVVAEAFDGRHASLGTLAVRVLKASPPLPGASRVDIRADGIVLPLGTKPIFPVGLWHLPGTERELAQLAEAGFNVVRCPGKDPETLAMVRRCGMFGMVPVPNQLPADAAARAAWEKKALEVVAAVRSSPALLGYYLIDEPLWNGTPPGPLRAAYEFYREKDPYHPVWINMAPRGLVADLARYNRACDITGVDIYPVPEGGSHSEMKDKSLACVGAYTEKMRRSVGDRKPVWMTLQGFAWKHLSVRNDPAAIYPDGRQSRFMAYDAIVHGAAGIFYWGTHTIADPDFWSVLLDTARDLHAAEGFLVWKTVRESAPVTDNKALAWLYKRAPEAGAKVDRAGARHVVVVVNETRAEVVATLRFPFGGDAVRAFDGELWRANPRSVSLREGRCREHFDPYEVRIYSDGALPIPSRPLPTGLVAALDGSSSLQRTARIRRDSEAYTGKAFWIWLPKKSGTADSRCALRYRFTLPDKPRNAALIATADDEFILRINGRTADRDDAWGRACRRDVTTWLHAGENTITVTAADAGKPPCGFLADVRLTMADGTKRTIVSNGDWQAADWDGKALDAAGFERLAWGPAEVVAPYGAGAWRDRLIIVPPE